MSTPPGIELADAVRAVRDGLMAAAADGEGQRIRFEVGPIQMEFTVEVRREAGGRAGVRAWVLDAGADARDVRGTTHRIAFTLTPKDVAAGGNLEIGNDDLGSTSLFGTAE